jgi:opacity protein-like surface antigen
MKTPRILSGFLVAVALSAAAPAFSQIVPAATEGQLPFSVGAGAENFNVDWSKSRMYGVGAWVQWHPQLLPHSLYGLGVDLEGKHIDFGRPDTVPSNFRQDSWGIGPIYKWHHYRYFQPYAKGLIGTGSIDFQIGNPYYTHDTKTVYGMGGGLQVRVLPHTWVRADYEYQAWMQLFGKTLDPQGFTLGATYDFRSLRFWSR